MPTRRSAVLVWRSLYALAAAFAFLSLEVFRRGGPLSIARKVHPLSGFAPLQSIRSKTRRELTLRESLVIAAASDTTHHEDDSHRGSNPPSVPRMAPLLRFLAPTAPSVGRVLFLAETSEETSCLNGLGLASPGAFPSSGFRSLLTAFSSTNFAGVFHPTGAHGVRPFRAFPFESGDGPYGPALPS